MGISWLQAGLLGLFACLSSLPGLGGTTFGYYTLGRPLVAGMFVGLILGDLRTGIMVGAAIQLVYIALVTPGGTISADLRAVSYIGIPLAMVALDAYGIDPSSMAGASLSTACGVLVGTVGTVLFRLTGSINSIWQGIGWDAIQKGDFKEIYRVNMVYPWISHIICSFIPAMIICHLGAPVFEGIQNYLPINGLAMKTILASGSLLPSVGVAILLKQNVLKVTDFIPFFFGFTLAASIVTR